MSDFMLSAERAKFGRRNSIAVLKFPIEERAIMKTDTVNDFLYVILPVE